MKLIPRIVCTAVAVASLSTGVGALAQKGNRAAQQSVALATVPVSVLESSLKLTSEQKSKIEAIRTKLDADTAPLKPAKGAPADPANRGKVADMTDQASKDVMGALTEDQKKSVPGLIKDLTLYKTAGLPLEAAAVVKLTDDQKSKIEAMIKEGMDKMTGLKGAERQEKRKAMTQEVKEKVMAMLTDEQKAKMETMGTGKKKKKKP